MDAVLDYVTRGILLTLTQLLIVLGPALAMAGIMHMLSSVMRRRAARLFGGDAFVWLTAPGTMVHELGHAVFCVIFRHRITDMKLFKPDDRGRLGYVTHRFDRRSPYQRIGNFFIGTGPIWFGAAVVWLLAWLLLDPVILEPLSRLQLSYEDVVSWSALTATVQQLTRPVTEVFQRLLDPGLLRDWKFWIFLYAVFSIGSHITLSRPDLQGATQGFIALVTVLLVFNWSTLWLGEFSLDACRGLTRYCAAFYSTMLFALLLSAAAALLTAALSLVRR